MLKHLPSILVTLLFFQSCSDKLSANDYTIDTASQNIVGGKIIPHSSDIAKSIVFISTKDESNRPSICTGTIISSNIILTAAHCIPKNNEDLYVTFRTSQFEKSFDQITLEVKKTTAIRLNEYERNDIALIEYAGGLPKGAKALKLFPYELKKASIQFSTAGFGKITGDENADPMATGESILRKTHLKGELKKTNDNLIYIDQEQQKTGVCFGDSGAPGYVIDKKTKALYVIGVASYVRQKDPLNKKADVCLQQSAFVKISPYLSLINSELNVNFSSQLN